ncbi:hypothetical protein PMX38_08275, partial [Collinsella aerofaciens]
KEAAPRGRRPKWLSHIVFHAKKPRATNPTYANKKLHNLFPISVHSLLDKRNYQNASLVSSGFRSIHNLR